MCQTEKESEGKLEIDYKTYIEALQGTLDSLDEQREG